MTICNFFQMAVWLPTTGKVFLPPSKPVARIYSTDEYVKEKPIYFHANTDRLLTVGHPYFPVKDANQTVLIPKVSSNQYRVFRLKLPDPNRFALIETDVYNPEVERLVWKLKGVEISRGGPIGIGTVGHPLFNKLNDTENPNKYFQGTKDSRQNVSVDPKQNQLFVLGCTPCIGEHWDKATPCAEPAPKTGDCPPLQVVNSYIEDGDMCDTGFGAMNFDALQEDRSDVPLDIVATKCKWPDFIKMTSDPYGDSCFFFGKREQMYLRHLFTRNGTVGDAIPQLHEQNQTLYVLGGEQDQDQKTASPSVYFGTPSGSLYSSDSQLFGRPYWIHRAQGMNNAVLWGNQVFITMVDNTHGTNFNISMYTEEGAKPQTYDSTKFKNYLRHAQEFEISIIVQLCSVPLDADVLAHIHVMNPAILEDWNLAFVPPPANSIEDAYRFIHSMATRCPDQAQPTEKVDPYEKYNFWTLDLSDRMSNELSQYSLGRRFTYQTTLLNGTASRKRKAVTSTPTKTVTTSRTVKRRRR